MSAPGAEAPCNDDLAADVTPAPQAGRHHLEKCCPPLTPPIPLRLACRRPKLAGTTFEKSLGSLLDKTERTERLLAPLAAMAGLEGALGTAAAAAHLAKADLATATVMEMTALAGTMGRHYAQKQVGRGFFCAGGGAENRGGEAMAAG